MLTLLLASAAVAAGGDADDDRPANDGRAKQRLAIMRQAIDDFQVRSSKIESPEGLKFRDQPLLRYNDQTRPGKDGIQALLDATAWRLGTKGRPLAIVTLEIYPSGTHRAVMTCEFVSLSPLAFELRNSGGIAWMPSSTELAMAPLPDAPEPADSARSRLAQLRQLARRFTAQAEWHGDKIECRLLPQPIDRYEHTAEDILDGAVFAFANGTNPELGLVLECSEDLWSYGVFRLTAATLWCQLDGKSFDLPAKRTQDPVKAPTTGTRKEIDLPE